MSLLYSASHKLSQWRLILLGGPQQQRLQRYAGGGIVGKTQLVKDVELVVLLIARWPA